MPTFNDGDIFWIDNFPPLDGGIAKRRPAVFLDLDDSIPADGEGPLVFVGATAGDEPDITIDDDAFYVGYGFPKPTWVLPRWLQEIQYSAVGEYVGKLPLVHIEPLINAVIDRYWDFDPDEAQ